MTRTQYDWPGNVRELRNVIERIMILEDKDRASTITDLPEEIVQAADGGVTAKRPSTATESVAHRR